MAKWQLRPAARPNATVRFQIENGKRRSPSTVCDPHGFPIAVEAEIFPLPPCPSEFLENFTVGGFPAHVSVDVLAVPENGGWAEAVDWSQPERFGLK